MLVRLRLVRLRSFARLAWERLVRYAVKFGIVGLVGYIVDVGVFNALRLGLLGGGPLQEPLGAKTVSVVIAVFVTWVGNRYWTFREHRRRDSFRELAEFSAVAAGGFAIGLLCLWVSHYVLGFTSLLADNIAANVVGLALGTAFRFLMYRFWVYRPSRTAASPARPESASAPQN